jgi:hypothetical protein
VFREVCAITGFARAPLERALDEAARRQLTLAPSRDRDVCPYVAALTDGQPGSGADDIVLRISVEMRASWERCALERRSTLDAWIEACLTERTECAVRWEIAAASEGRTLAEWIYASALAAPASTASSSA